MHANHDSHKRLTGTVRAAFRRHSIRILSGSILASLVLLVFAVHLGIVPLPGEARYPQSWQPYSAPRHAFTARIPAGWQVTTSQGTSSEGSLQISITLSETFITIRDPAATGMVIFVAVERADNPVAWRMLVCANQPSFILSPTRTIAGYPAQYFPIGHDSFDRYVFYTSAGDYQLSFRPAHFQGGGLGQADPFGTLNDWLHHDDAQQRRSVAQQVYQEFVASLSLGLSAPEALQC